MRRRCENYLCSFGGLINEFRLYEPSPDAKLVGEVGLVRWLVARRSDIGMVQTVVLCLEHHYDCLLKLIESPDGLPYEFACSQAELERITACSPVT